MMKLDEYELTDKQQIALAALVEQPTVSKAAQNCGISPPTLYRWKKSDPVFKQALRAARWAALEDSRKRVEERVDIATDTLVDVMLDKTNSGSSRVGAARTLWSIARSNYDLDEVTEMVEDLTADDATEAY